MKLLIGSTGFVGGHLASRCSFDVKVHRSNIESISGTKTDLLVCAGLPAEKWRANQQPSEDWANTRKLAQILSQVHATRAVLISTVDVYQAPLETTEEDIPELNGESAYGFHRAWFEVCFRSRFPNSLIVRLPALFAPDVKKNLVHDLLHNKEQHLAQINPESEFQYFDVRSTWTLIEKALIADLKVLNVSVEPIRAQAIADLFRVTLSGKSSPVRYDVRSIHSEAFGGERGYLFDASHSLMGIGRLREPFLEL